MKLSKITISILFLSLIGCAQEEPKVDRNKVNKKSSDVVVNGDDTETKSSLQSKKLENFDGVIISDDSVNVDDQTQTPSDGFSAIDVANENGESIFYDEDGNDKPLSKEDSERVKAIDGVEVVEVDNGKKDDKDDFKTLEGDKDEIDKTKQFDKLKVSNLKLMINSEEFPVSKFDNAYTPMVITLSEKFSDVVWNKIPNFDGMVAIPKDSDVDIVIGEQPKLNLAKRTDGPSRVESRVDNTRSSRVESDTRFDSRIDDVVYNKVGNDGGEIQAAKVSELRQRFKKQLEEIQKTNNDPAKAEVVKTLIKGVKKQILKEKLMRFALPTLAIGVIVQVFLIIGLSNDNDHLKDVIKSLEDENQPKEFGYVKFNEPTEVVILGQYDSETDSYKKLGTMVLDGSIGSLIQE